MSEDEIDEEFRSKLLENIGGIFHQYIMNGDARITPFTENINMNIDDLDTVLKIHFLMPYQTEDDEVDKLDVIDFMKNVKKRIREINTVIKKEKERFQGGEVKGKIDFSSTFKERLMHNPFDETLFVCNVIDKDFNTDENKVLKTFLEVIWDILSSDKIKNQLEYDYLKEYWIDKREIGGGKVSFKKVLENLLKNNIYLRNIEIEKEEVLRDDRLLNDVSKSRNDLYREAAELLIRYKKVVIDRNIDLSEAKELLRHTFIKPKRMDLLFELYWTLQIVDEFKDANPRFKPIQKGENIIAYWEKDGFEYKIYHNSSGGDDIKIGFREDHEKILEKLKETEISVEDNNIVDTFIGRELKIMKHFEKMDDKIELWGGDQPDIILEKISKDSRDIEEVFVGEVKYSGNENYKKEAKNGMKELLEYMSLIGEKEYWEESDKLFQSLEKVKGGLFVKGETEVGNITDTASENVEIIRYDNEERTSLRKILDIG